MHVSIAYVLLHHKPRYGSRPSTAISRVAGISIKTDVKGLNNRPDLIMAIREDLVASAVCYFHAPYVHRMTSR
jgi:hypothetical protein